MSGAMRRLRYTQATESACAAIGMALYKYIQQLPQHSTAWPPAPRRSHDSPVRVLAHIKKLDDCFGQFLVRVNCPCGTSRHIEPEALARLVGWNATLEQLAQRMRCSQCGKKAAEVVAVARPRPRGCRRIRTSDGLLRRRNCE
jgi:hypothetical protein